MNKNFSQLINSYLIAIENPDSFGWDNEKQIWKEPTEPGCDKNQRGIGLDIRKNKKLAEYLRNNPREGNYLTKEEEQHFRYSFLDYLDEVFTRNTQKLNMSNISEKKKAMAFGLMYQGHGTSLWQDQGDGLYQAFTKGDDQAFQDSISNFYSTRNSERMRNHDSFWKSQKPKSKLIPKRRINSQFTISHVEQPDVLKVAKPNIVLGHVNGGKLAPRHKKWYVPTIKLTQILEAIKNFKFSR